YARLCPASLLNAKRDIERVGAAPHQQRDDAAFLELSHQLAEPLERFHVLVIDRQNNVAATDARARGRTLNVLDQHTAGDLELTTLLGAGLRQCHAEAAPGLRRRLDTGGPRRGWRCAVRASSCISPTTTVTSRVALLRINCTLAFDLGLLPPTSRGRSSDEFTSLPSNLRITSPASMPAFSAGLPFSTELTNAPLGLGKPNDSASSLVTG